MSWFFYYRQCTQLSSGTKRADRGCRTIECHSMMGLRSGWFVVSLGEMAAIPPSCSINSINFGHRNINTHLKELDYSHKFIEVFVIADSTISWSNEPKEPTEAVEGENATLRWDYNLGGLLFLLVKWYQILDGKETEIAKRVLANSPEIFYNFTGRLLITHKATLIITNVSRTDTGKYKCAVTPQSGKALSSTRQLDVLCKLF